MVTDMHAQVSCASAHTLSQRKRLDCGSCSLWCHCQLSGFCSIQGAASDKLINASLSLQLAALDAQHSALQKHVADEETACRELSDQLECIKVGI